MRGKTGKLRVMTVLGTRPEVIRLSRVIEKLDQHCDHTLVHTGQNYDFELNEIFFDELEIRSPDYFLGAAGKTGVQTIGNVIIAVDQLLDELQPDALLVLGDTNSCMAVLPAKRRKIPTFHMEAGNRCFDMRVPEEINRRMVDHIADINLTYSSIAREYLITEGLPPDRIIKTGSPMSEVINHFRQKIEKSTILEQLDLHANSFFLVSAHREENIESNKNFHQLVALLNKLATVYDLPVIVSLHPRTRAKISKEQVEFESKVVFLKPLGFLDYNKLQISAKVAMSDSGTITEESSLMNFPALNLRQAHERPEGMEEAAVMMVGLSIERVFQGIDILSSQGRGEHRGLRVVADYDADNVSEKIVRILHSYTDYINRTVWKRY